MLDRWQEWVGTETGVVVLTVVTLPVAAAVVVGLALAPGEGQGRGLAVVAGRGGPRVRDRAVGGGELTVENTGEQLDPQAVATFTEPFRRGTDRLRSDHAGLGLAIVAGIVAAHDGTVTLAPLDAGGLRVTVCLPPVAPSGRSSERGP